MKRKDFIETIRKASDEELNKKVHELSDELLRIRIKQATGQHEGGGRRTALRREVARSLTELNSRAQRAAVSK